MRRFSIGAAIGEAFGLMRRRPFAVFVWGLVVLAPALLSMAFILPAMGDIFAHLPEDPAAGEDVAPAMMARMFQFQLISMLANVDQLVGMVVAYTAIMRAVLRPGERSAFSLRIGMDELRVAVAGVAVGAGLYAAILLVFLFGAALVAALWGAGEAVAIGAAVVIALAAIVAVFWGLARVSLIAPASVLYRDFAFAQGWRLAAGKAWPLLGMMLLVMLIVLAIEVVLIGIGIAVAATAFAGAGPAWMETDNPFPFLHAWLSANWPWLAVAGVVLVGLYGVFLTLSVAPFASACRQLAEGDAPAESAEAV